MAPLSLMTTYKFSLSQSKLLVPRPVTVFVNMALSFFAIDEIWTVLVFNFVALASVGSFE